MKKLLLSIALMLSIAGCTTGNETVQDNGAVKTVPKAQRILEDNGYTDVQLTGYRFFICGDDYTFHDGFRAKAPGGHVVTGAVCSGFFKGATIKLD